MTVWVVIQRYWDKCLEPDIVGIYDSEEKALAEKGNSARKAIEQWEIE